MPHRDSAPLGAPCWVDLYTSDPDQATDFYGQLFGWTAESAGEEYGGYLTFSKGSDVVAGAMRNDGEQGAPDAWTIYLATDDIAAVAAATEANGGQVVMGPMEIPQAGHMAIVADSGEAAVGVWQPGEHKGFAVLAEPGTPGWFELHTRRYDDAVSFYEKVFGWDTYAASDTPEFRYTTLGEGDQGLAGIMDAAAFLPDGVPAHWSVYFQVEDTDAALAEIGRLGGSTILAAEDTPYGRLAQAADPTGAAFKLLADA